MPGSNNAPSHRRPAGRSLASAILVVSALGAVASLLPMVLEMEVGHLLPIVGLGCVLIMLVITFSRHETQLRLADEQSEQQRRVRFALEAMQAGTWEWELNTNLNYWSDSLWGLYGLERSAHRLPTFESWSLSIHPEDRERVVATVRNAAEHSQDFDVEWRVNATDGKQRWLHSRGQYQPDTVTASRRYVGIVTDVTAQRESAERQRVSEALAQELDVVQQVLDAANTGYWDMDTRTGRHRLSPTLKRTLGFADHELDDSIDAWYARVAPEDRDSLKAQFEQHEASHGEIPLSREIRLLHRDGADVWAIFSGCVVAWNPDGSMARAAGCLIDITPRKRLEQEREAANQQRLATILDNVGAQIYIKDCDYRYIYANQRVCEAFDRPLDALIGCSDAELLDAHTATMLRQNDKQVIEAGQRIEREEAAIVPASRELRTYLSIKLPLRTGDGTIYGLVGISTDITDRKAIEETLREKEQLFRDMSEIAHVGGWAFDPATGEGTWTEETARIHEVDVNSPTSAAMGLSFYTGESRLRIEESIKELLETGRPYDLELELITPSGNRKWIRTVGHPQYRDGKVVRVRGAIQDITQSKENQNRIWREANFDALTGLPNRRMLYDRMEQEMRKARRSGTALALMLLDLDHFKEVNDTLGHDKGDVLLKEASERIRQCVRDTDTVARLGGDEFVIMLSLPDDSTHVERVANQVLQKLEDAFHLQGEVAYVSASIGITLYPDDARRIEDLFKNADQAMYAAKNQGRNRYSYFTPHMQHAAQLRMQIATDLRGALANEEFTLYYQPIVDLTSGEVRKAEALIRWQHPKHGIISPAAFIPIAEETRAIVEIGNWVLRMATHQVARWRRLFHPDFQVSVNKSPVQFLNDTNPGWLDQLAELDLPQHSIVMEITEGLLLRVDPLVEEKFARFREAGIEVALDDFGTGYSSLSYIKKFDIDFLKIDQAFVRNLSPGSSDLALCEAIVVMAHKLGIRVIAEGIETAMQRDLLAAAGCDYGQGYLFSPPLPAAQFEALPALKKKALIES